MVHSHDLSTIILQQFCMIIQEIKSFANKVLSDITKTTQAYTAVHENMGKLMENAISPTITKAQDVTTPIVTIDSRNFRVNHTKAPHMKQIGPHPGQELTLFCHNTWKMTQIRLKDLTKHIHSHMLVQTNSPQSDILQLQPVHCQIV